MLRHMEDHRKAIPPPAEQIKKNLNVRAEIPPQVAMQEIGGAMTQDQQAQESEATPTAKPMGSPRGGESGEMYEPSPGPSLGDAEAGV